MTEHTGCSHDFDAHHVIAGDDPREGGVVRCPECDCRSTWGVNGAIPDPELVRVLNELYDESVLARPQDPTEAEIEATIRSIKGV